MCSALECLLHHGMVKCSGMSGPKAILEIPGRQCSEGALAVPSASGRGANEEANYIHQ